MIDEIDIDDQDDLEVPIPDFDDEYINYNFNREQREWSKF